MTRGTHLFHRCNNLLKITNFHIHQTSRKHFYWFCTRVYILPISEHLYRWLYGMWKMSARMIDGIVPAAKYVWNTCNREVVVSDWLSPRELVYSGLLGFITTWSALVINQITQFMALKRQLRPLPWFSIYIKQSYSDHLGCGLLLLYCRIILNP